MRVRRGKNLPAGQILSLLFNCMFWGGGQKEDGVGRWGAEEGKGWSQRVDKFTGLSVNQPEAEILPLDFPFT